VDCYRAKNNGNTANARTVTVPDGRKLFGGFKETPGNPFK
jgi:lysozyme family protein